MRPFDSDYNEIDEFNEFGYGGIEAIRRVAKNRQQLEQQLEGRKRRGHARKDPWDEDFWGQCDGYNEDEFDQFSGINLGHH